MKRTSHRTPGWDCISGPCTHQKKCDTANDPGGSHGRHGEEWTYTVVSDDRRTATHLAVYTSIMPDCTPKDMKSHDPPRGATLSTCVAFATSATDSDHQVHCEYLGQPCRGAGTTFTRARDMFATHGVALFEQPERFWLALEAWHAIVVKDAEAGVES